MRSIQITGDVDSGNPRNECIVCEGDNRFRLNAFSETDRESFRLEVRIHNAGSEPRPLHLDIRWPTEPFSELRDCFYWKHDNDADWSVRLAVTSPGATQLNLTVPPGEGWLCLHPHYGYEDSEAFIASLESPCLEKRITARTEAGRNVHHLIVSEPLTSGVRPALLGA